jgi:large subunit ribosomal protein L22
MEIKASAKYVAVSPKKARQVTDLISGKSVEEVLAFLKFETKYIAIPVSKLIKSAIAIAEEKGLDKDKLLIKGITVDNGPIGKKQRIRARGRADLQKRRTSHITVILEEKKIVKDKKDNKNIKVNKKSK